jgi:hypothetical protein
MCTKADALQATAGPLRSILIAVSVWGIYRRGLVGGISARRRSGGNDNRAWSVEPVTQDARGREVRSLSEGLARFH